MEKLLLLDEILGCTAVLYVFPHCVYQDFDLMLANYAVGFSVPTLWDMLNDINRIRKDPELALTYHKRS